MNAKDLINVLTNQDIIHLMKELGCDNYIDKSSEIIFQTICHGGKSMKLYYYNENKKFQCYSHCGSMSVYDLIMKVKECNFATAFKFLKDLISDSEMRGYGFDFSEEKIVNLDEIVVEDLPQIKKKFLYTIFDKTPIEEWLNEGITAEVQKKYNIRYDKKDNRAIIPVFQNSKCVGIRTRNFNPIEVERGRKYVPLWYDDVCYNFPTQLALYGLDEVKENIKKYKKIVIVEGEKSCLKSEVYYPNSNICVAMLGSSLSMTHKKIIIELGVEEVILAMDKEFEEYGSDESLKYEQKIIRNFKGLEGRCKCSYVIDKWGLLNIKDAPVDKGKDVFKKLLDRRVII